MGSSEVFDALRLTQVEVEALILELNRANARSPAATKRSLRRWPMQFQRCVLTTNSKMMGKVHAVGYPRNLSRRGVALLSGTFVHPGTSCHVILRSITGTAKCLEGVCRWCRHVRARAHDVGIELQTAVHPRDFFIQQGSECLFQMESVDVSTLKGNLLLVDNDRLTHKLFQDLLGNSNVDVWFAESGEQAISLLNQSPDLVVCEYQLPEMTGLDLLIKSREMGHQSPFLLMAREGDTELRLAAIGAGANELLMRPLTPEVVLRGVAEVLSETLRIDDAPARPASNTLAIPVESLVRLAQEGVEAAEAGNIDGARASVQRLGTTANEFGASALGLHAERVASSIVASVPIPKLTGDLRSLLRECQHLEKAGATKPRHADAA